MSISKITGVILAVLFSVAIIILMIFLILREATFLDQYNYIVVDGKEYAIEELSNIWYRTDFIEFTTKDGERIHATIYKLKK